MRRQIENTVDTLRAAEGEDVLELRNNSSVSFEQSNKLFDADKQSLRNKTLVFGLMLLALTLFSLCIGTIEFATFYNPLEILTCYGEWLRLNVLSLFDPTISGQLSSVIKQHPMYLEVTARFGYTMITILCGTLLSVAGMLYQNVFRNPIAAPTMLGVSNGISLGIMLMVAVYGTGVVSMLDVRFLYCYTGGIGVLLLVLLSGKFISGKRPMNLVDVLLVATIISSLVGTIVTYVTNYAFTDAQWQAYYDISNVTYLDTSLVSIFALFVSTAIAFVPVYFFRFRLNCIAFSDEEMRIFGISPNGLRFLALACGSIMILTAQIFTGTVAMVSLVVPFVTRAVFGSEFRMQMLGNIFIGAIVLLVCRDLVALIPFVGDGIPIGTMVTFVTLPAFVWVMSVAQKQWND